MTNQYKAGAILSYATIFIGNIAGLIYTPIMLRMLGQSEYGLYALVGSMIATLSLVDLGFGNASIRYISKYRALGNQEKEYNVNGMFVIINTFICFLTLVIGAKLYFYLLTPLFGGSLSASELHQFKIMFAVLVFNLAVGFPFSVFGSILVSYERFTFPKIIGLVRTILNPIVILCVLFLGYKSLGMVIANTVINLLFLWVNVYYCFKILKVKVYFKQFDWKLCKEIAVYSGFIFLAIIVDKIYWSTDQFILGMFSGTTAVAVYAIASQFNMYYMQFSTAISGMFLPRVTTMVVKDAGSRELSELFIKIGRIQFLVLGLVLSGFVLFGKEFIGMWAGQEYTSSYLMAVLLIVPFTVPLIQNMGLTILQAKNLHGFRSTVYFFIALGNLGISIPLAKAYGGLGCAAGTALSMIIGNIIIINIYYYKKIKLDIPRFWLEIGKIALPLAAVAAVGAASNLWIAQAGIGIFVAKTFFFVLAYGFVMYKFGMNAYERALLASLFARFFPRGKQMVSQTQGEGG